MIDHRRLGRELDLFVSDPLAGAGLPIWLPAGAAARHAVEEYVRELERRAGYQHVYSPPLGKRELVRALRAPRLLRRRHVPADAAERRRRVRAAAGALPAPRAGLPGPGPLLPGAAAADRRAGRRCTGPSGPACSAGCPGCGPSRSTTRTTSAPSSRSAPRSREILRLIRARARRRSASAPAGFRLSLRGPGRSTSATTRSGPGRGAAARPRSPGWSTWRRPGEAAFYGPKIDIQIVDAAGRESTLSTVQLDFDKPEQFDLSYTDSDGARQRPVMVHRSLVGSMERLFALPDRGARGRLPGLVRAGPAGAAAGRRRAGRRGGRAGPRAVDAGLRVEVDAAGSLGARVRDAARRRVPYLGVVGAREVADGAVAAAPARRPRPGPDARGGRALALIGAVVAARVGGPAPPPADPRRPMRSPRPPAAPSSDREPVAAAGSSSTTAAANCAW